MGHIERIEGMMEAMAREPDRVFHEAYLLYVLHNCAGLEALAGAQREELLDALAMACTVILCPPIVTNVLEGEVYLLVQQNPDKCAQDIADAAGLPLRQWAGEYSCVSIGTDDVPMITAAINDGSIIALLASWYGEE